MQLSQLGPVCEGSAPLRWGDVPEPGCGDDEVLIRVSVCGVCHTELDEIEGRTPPPRLPVIPGHQVVGRIVAAGGTVNRPMVGDRVGVAWIRSACGLCAFCRSERENLCPDFQGTGRDADGGYAEFLSAPAAFVFPIPEGLEDVQAAPYLCAGAIGYRSLRLTNLRNGQRLGLTGFGSSARLVLKLARQQFPDSDVYVFARAAREQEAARDLGAAWAGSTQDLAPAPLDAIIDTTPAWTPVAEALSQLAPGGRLVINAIRKESADQAAMASLSYERQLWMEKEVKSVANVTRRDVAEFLKLASTMRLHTPVEEYPLAEANRALVELKTRPVTAAKVLVVAR